MTTTTTGLQIKLSAADLSTALQSVTRAISARTTLPILLNVLMETTEEGLSLTATNLEISIRKVVPAEVGQGGVITVPAKLLADFVACLPPAPLTIEATGSNIALACGRFNTTILGIEAAEFPPGPQAEDGDELTIPLDDLLQAIDQTGFAASTDEARPVLTGELLHIEGTKATLVATDGHRLAEWRTTLAADGDIGVDENLAAEGARLIIPARALAELPRAFAGSDEPVTLIVSKARNQVFFRSGSSEVASRLIDGQYPNYGQVIPARSTTTVRTNRKGLLAALKAAAVFARDSAHVVRLTVPYAAQTDTDPGTLALRTAVQEVGDSNVELDALVTGAVVEVAFNVHYLTDAVAAAAGDEVEIRLDGPLTPALVSGEGDRYRCVVMPVRISAAGAGGTVDGKVAG